MKTDTKSIDQFMAHVQQTFEQAERSNFAQLLRFIILGASKLAAFGAVLWMLRHI